ncbi:MAG: hypothetical protein WKF38_03665, partial [Candidatus Limnocylindrales bacterium]
MSDRTSRIAVALMSAILLTYVVVHPPVSRLIREIVGIDTVCALCGPGPGGCGGFPVGRLPACRIAA